LINSGDANALTGAQGMRDAQRILARLEDRCGATSEYHSGASASCHSYPVLDRLLRRAVDHSFHEISVDGDTSTSDAVILTAGGASMEPLSTPGAALSILGEAIVRVARELAMRIVEDGEGITRLMVLKVRGAPDHQAARTIAEGTVRSPLVKTALAGGDPNWGRIIAAAGVQGVPLDTERLTLRIGGHPVFAASEPIEFDRSAVEAVFSSDIVPVELDLGLGPGEARMVTSDLGRRYVEINSEYTT